MKHSLTFACAALALSAVTVQGSVSLTATLERALRTDPRYLAIQANYEAGIEDGEQVRATRRPSVSAFGLADANATRSDSTFFGRRRESYPAYRVGLEARQPVYRRDWKQRARRAEGLEHRAEARFLLDQQAYFYFLSEAFIEAILAKENLMLAETEADAVRESLRDTRNRREAGVVAATDLFEAEARDDLAQARLLSAEQALADSRERLEEAVGPVGRLPRLSEDADLRRTFPENLDFWMERALDTSPALQAARAFARVAASEVDSLRADRAPRLDLVGQVTRSDMSESTIGERGTDGRIGLELTVPFYRGGELNSSIRQAVALRRAADHELEGREREIRREVRSGWRNLEVAGREVEAFGAAVRSAESAERATANGYEAGIRTIVDVLNARSATVAARRDLSQARHRMVLAQIRLRQLAGVLNLDALSKYDALFH